MVLLIIEFLFRVEEVGFRHVECKKVFAELSNGNTCQDLNSMEGHFRLEIIKALP